MFDRVNEAVIMYLFSSFNLVFEVHFIYNILLQIVFTSFVGHKISGVAVKYRQHNGRFLEYKKKGKNCHTVKLSDFRVTCDIYRKSSFLKKLRLK